MGSGTSSIIMIVVMVAIFYFMLIRPQQKETKKKNEMLSAMKVGDTVMTTSGFYGVLIDVSDDTVIVEFGSNRNCRIPMSKQAISAVESPADAAAAEKARVEEAKKEEAKKEESKESSEEAVAEEPNEQVENTDDSES